MEGLCALGGVVRSQRAGMLHREGVGWGRPRWRVIHNQDGWGPGFPLTEASSTGAPLHPLLRQMRRHDSEGMTLPDPLARRLADGHTHLLRSDVVRLGLDPHTLRRWVNAGHLHALGHGEYVIDAPAAPGASEHETRREQYLRRCSAVLAGNTELHLVGPSAAMAHGLPLLTMPSRIDVSGPRRRRPSRALLAARMPWGGAPVVAAGLRCQNAAESVIEIAVVDGVRDGLVSADALAHRTGSVAVLEEALGAFGARPGVRRARAVVESADAASESPGETLIRHVCAEHGITLVPQVIITDDAGRFVARVDFLVAGTDVVVEFDGLAKYRSDTDLRAEKLRQLALERCGYRVLRFVWADLARPDFILDCIRRAALVAA